MKALCTLLALLLLGTFCSAGMPRGVGLSTSPGVCCFNVSQQTLIPERVASITKTHSSCPRRGFIVTTKKQKKICYSGTFQWALDMFNQKHRQPQQ